MSLLKLFKTKKHIKETVKTLCNRHDVPELQIRISFCLKKDYYGCVKYDIKKCDELIIYENMSMLLPVTTLLLEQETIDLIIKHEFAHYLCYKNNVSNKIYNDHGEEFKLCCRRLGIPYFKKMTVIKRGNYRIRCEYCQHEIFIRNTAGLNQKNINNYCLCKNCGASKLVITKINKETVRLG